MKKFFTKEWRSEYVKFLGSLHKLTWKEWLKTSAKVAAIVAFGFISLFALDYALSESIPVVQIFLSKVHLSAKWFYLVAMGLTMFFVVITVLLQQGAKDGLTSMLGSGVQYGDITGTFTNRVGIVFNVSTALLFAELILSPVFLGGVS